MNDPTSMYKAADFKDHKTVKTFTRTTSPTRTENTLRATAQNNARPIRNRTSIALALLLFLGLIASLTTGCGSDDPEHTLAGVRRHPSPNVSSLSLPLAHNGVEQPFIAEQDKLLLVYFGFTSCPDICPTSMSDTRLAFNRLKEKADRLDIVFVSVDPERDTSEILDKYIKSFFPEGMGMRTDDPAALAEAAEAFGARYRIDKAEQYNVDHSGDIYVVDDKGDIILTWTFGVPASNVAADIKVLLDEVDKR